MNNISRTIFIIAITLIFLIAFSPSYTSLNIDNLAYVIGLGIDEGGTEKYKISFQFPAKKSDDSNSSNQGKEQKQGNSSEIVTVEAPSIDTAINLMNSYLAKKINLSHCKVIVFSDKVASKGIENEIYTLINNSEIRPSASIIISSSEAEKYLENSSPILEEMISKYYEIFPYTSKYTGYIYNSTLGDFYSNLVSEDSEPYAILGSVNTEVDNNIEGTRDSKNIGLAVFKDGKLVGDLDENETLCFSIIKGDINSFIVRIPVLDNTKELDMIVFPKSHSIKVKIKDNFPYIEYKGKFEARIHSIDNNSKYLNSNILENISSSLNSYLTDMIKNYLYKTAQDYKSDINGFGKYSLSSFQTIPKFEQFDWKSSYQNSIFDVNITTLVDSSILITET